MKINEVINTKKPILFEAKARIDHPEDIIFDDNGTQGALRALDAMVHASQNHGDSTTIKWDGSPAVIFGWVDKNSFIVTDKAGMGAKKYNGKPTSSQELQSMIFNRRPDEEGRQYYANKFASIYELLKKATPKSLVGQMIQGDLLYMSADDIVHTDEDVTFGPVKVRYTIDKDNPVGAKIAKSQCGIAVHSVFNSVDDASAADGEPSPVTPKSLGLKDSPKLVIFGPETQIPTDTEIKLPMSEVESVRNLIKSGPASQIDDMLDPFTMGSLKIANLPELFKKFVNFKARAGEDIGSAPELAKDFINWVEGPAGLTDNKKKNVLAHLQQFKAPFEMAWRIVSALSNIKHTIKDQLDTHVSGVKTDRGHEGFVSATPHGKIKFVNRPNFMKKD